MGPFRTISEGVAGFVVSAGFGGGKEIRTPDIQLAKLALYQLSYTPKSVSKEFFVLLWQPCGLPEVEV